MDPIFARLNDIAFKRYTYFFLYHGAFKSYDDVSKNLYFSVFYAATGIFRFLVYEISYLCQINDIRGS